MMASKTKLNAPFAHTYLQIIRKRWGLTLHAVHLFFALAANVLVGSMLILGGSATVNQLTGMPTLAAIFLTPVSVAIYTLVGGLRATFLADYAHTAVLIALILAFSFTVYAGSDKIGSPTRMFEMLEAAAPVADNAAGSYTTMRSLDGLKFGVCVKSIGSSCDSSLSFRSLTFAETSPQFLVCDTVYTVLSH